MDRCSFNGKEEFLVVEKLQHFEELLFYFIKAVWLDI